MRGLLLNIVISLTFAVMSAEQRVPLRQPIPIVQFLEAPPRFGRKRAVKRLYPTIV